MNQQDSGNFHLLGRGSHDSRLTFPARVPRSWSEKLHRRCQAETKEGLVSCSPFARTEDFLVSCHVETDSGSMDVLIKDVFFENI